MKTFKEYLTESIKTYDFKVKMACTCDAKDIEKIKEALTKFKVESVSQPKRLPIQESPEFPNCGPVEISIFNVSLNYPANDEQVRQAIASCGAPASMIRVIPSGHPYELILDGKEVSNVDGKEGESVLLQSEMKAQSVTEKDEVLPQHRMNGLIKEILDARNYEYPTVTK